MATLIEALDGPERKLVEFMTPYYHYGSCVGGDGRLTNNKVGARMGWKRPSPVGAVYRGVSWTHNYLKQPGKEKPHDLDRD
ncbi:MAG: hypothetical protein KBE23_22445 [Chloroflexi bacterium]|nr:hypothetical protein [Chloroflexota bacterium]MBP7045528.1 hypothetical protein [Chloroflexota bacterium]